MATKEDSIDLTGLERVSMQLVGRVEEQDGDLAREIQDDLDSISILMTLCEDELGRRDIQWIICHLLGHVQDESDDPEAELGIEEDLDAYIAEAAKLLETRGVKLSCPFLTEALTGVPPVVESDPDMGDPGLNPDGSDEEPDAKQMEGETDGD